jgi:hypothetical protein
LNANFALPCGGYSAFRSTKSDKKFQKGLDFGGEESVSAPRPLKSQRLFRDPAPLAMMPLRGFGGDGAWCRRNRKKDPKMSHSKTPTKTKPARAKTDIPSAVTRAGTKQEAVLTLLRQPEGTTSPSL